MEPVAQKGLERVISQKAMQMGNSTSCKIWVLGFFCGVCITYLFLVAFSPFRSSTEVGMVFSRAMSAAPVSQNSSSLSSGISNKDIYTSLKILGNLSEGIEPSEKERVMMLYNAWSALLDEGEERRFAGIGTFNVPHAPHLENCSLSAKLHKQFDKWGENRSFPPWTLWRGSLGIELLHSTLSKDQKKAHISSAKSEGAYPPWVLGSDEDNYPLTRLVQKDIWIRQHPQNCNDPNLKFLLADWERLPGFGIGAQLAGMAGLMAIAINENRILVTDYYNRADHGGCQGSSRSHWSCYFFSETSDECRKRALDLTKNEAAWAKRIITVKDNYSSKEIWAGKVPRAWGRPWNLLQPTTEVNGSLLWSHRKIDSRWWRAQAIRYLMRFKSEYMCHLLNVDQHKAFGLEAAKMVIKSLPASWPKKSIDESQTEIDHFVWSIHKPWTPRPLLSLHVRMGDKACEMKVVGFEHYIQLAEKMRKRFPDLNSIWLSTEMQEVIDKTRLYPHWNFYYTKNVTRQVGNTTMAEYEASLGRETSTNYPLVNFIMAAEADFFIGALGSTWCYLIDGMRNTGGKVMAGYLSVNKDRFW
ncbi:hypothetical protein Cni_G21697 [Canna indica]|uniref:Alpha-(1,6)-fucosyltransferase n=1 Tax=Canna indica TaxID=4628 RepID=A0AAQ3QKJ5_9LILI|nr:hypothetical protein Cni_G21697 [Canna indica]